MSRGLTALKLTKAGGNNALDIYKTSENRIVIKKNYKRSKSKYSLSYYPDTEHNRKVLYQLYGSSLVNRWLSVTK